MNRVIKAGFPCFIIAEAGVNHNGSLRLAKKLVDSAKFAGADAVKFQAFKTNEIVTKDAPMAEYQKKAFSGKKQFYMLKRLELSNSGLRELFLYCKEKKIIFLATPFDVQSADYLNKLGVFAFKIGSGELTNTPLLCRIAKYRRPIILSTGMATLGEVREAVNAIYSTGNKKLVLFHCTSEYPAKYENLNLKAINTLKREFNVPVGYSDHTEGIEAAVAATAMGACVIEKHFTLDKNLPGPDHKASLDTYELKDMVRSIRNIEKAMGDGIKKPQRCEKDIMKVIRKSIVAVCYIPKGARITKEMLTSKRPGTGIQPKFLKKLINKIAKTNIKKNQFLNWKDVGI